MLASTSLRARGTFGLAALALLALLTLTWLATRAKAAAAELAHDAGALLMSYAGDPGEAPRSLSVNGARMHVLTGRSRDSLDTVLDTYAARCRSHSPWELTGAVAQAARRATVAANPSILDGVLRIEGADHGFVACFDTGRASLSAEELVQRLERVAASRNLAELGGLRFAWATRVQHDRQAATSRYVAVWTDGDVPLEAMFPASGDAAGIDVPDLPRPPRARRVLSVYQEDEAPMVAAYASNMDPAALVRGYVQTLQRAGLSARERARSSASDPYALHASRGELSWLVLVEAVDDSPSNDGPASLVSVLPMH